MRRRSRRRSGCLLRRGGKARGSTGRRPPGAARRTSHDARAGCGGCRSSSRCCSCWQRHAAVARKAVLVARGCEDVGEAAHVARVVAHVRVLPRVRLERALVVRPVRALRALQWVEFRLSESELVAGPSHTHAWRFASMVGGRESTGQKVSDKFKFFRSMHALRGAARRPFLFQGSPRPKLTMVVAKGAWRRVACASRAPLSAPTPLTQALPPFPSRRSRGSVRGRHLVHRQGRAGLLLQCVPIEL